MELTTEQREFLNTVCYPQYSWELNFEGEIDVDGKVDMANMSLTEIPIKFGTVKGWFICGDNKLTSMKNFPKIIVGGNLQMVNNNISNFDYFPLIVMSRNTVMSISDNPLTDYFKNIKEDEFPYWRILNWWSTIQDYPFLINIAKKYTIDDFFKDILNHFPQAKLYLKD
jgi:hypothetical protein